MLVTGRVPFPGNNQAQIISNIKRHAAKPTLVFDMLRRKMLRVHTSKTCFDIVSKLLCVDPKTRLGSAEVIGHRWISHAPTAIAPAPDAKFVKAGAVVADVATDSDSILESVMKFRKFGQLKRSALLAMALSASASELASLNSAFREFDKDSTGVIRIKEFKKVMKSHGVRKRSEIEGYFEALDQDKTGLIKYSEFVAAALAERMASDEEQVTAAFGALDLDDSGKITVANLKKLLGPGHDADAIARIIAEADTAYDGAISLAELKSLFGAPDTVDAANPAAPP